MIVPEGSLAHTRNGDKTKELPYMVMLNRNLPQDIRVTGWTTVDPSFSARFDCQGRTYKYFFPLGKMNLEVCGCTQSHVPVTCTSLFREGAMKDGIILVADTCDWNQALNSSSQMMYIEVTYLIK